MSFWRRLWTYMRFAFVDVLVGIGPWAFLLLVWTNVAVLFARDREEAKRWVTWFANMVQRVRRMWSGQ
jgi:hypothetical protein